MNADLPETFRIGPATFTADSPVYVVAEIGVNHDGSAALAREMIHAAADAEADAVKFQVFSADRLVVQDAPAATYQKQATKAETQFELLRRLELTCDDLAELAVYAGHCGVEFLATPFSVEDLRAIVGMGVRAIKLASPDIVNRPLLEAAAQSRLPLIVSTGAADMNEVAQAVRLLRGQGAGPLALLHCVSSYPASECEANLRAISTLGQAFECVSGFSDHTPSLTIGGYAAAAGARIIEKHMTLDRTGNGPDHAFSLEPDQLARYIRGIRQTESLLGDGRVTALPSEQDVRHASRASVVAACDIDAGQVITPAMLTVKRPGGGIPPDQMAAIVGREAVLPVSADTPLSWSMVSQQPAHEMIRSPAPAGP